MDREPIPKVIDPMLATSARGQPNLDHYIFEFKWDGYRAILFWDGHSVRLQSRNRIDLSERYPEIASLTDQLPRYPLVLDGEIVAFDQKGLPDFGLLQRIGKERQSEAVNLAYLAFDLLYLDGKVLFDEPYSKRRQLLEEQPLREPPLQIPPSTDSDLEVALEAAANLQLEGVVAKRLDSLYRPGKRSREWLKFKIVKRQEFVVGGWSPQSGDSRIPGALLLGYYSGDELVFVGNVGSGFTDSDSRELAQKLQPLKRATSPFDGPINRPVANYVESKLVAEVEFRGITNEGLLRQASYKGLRFDKNPKEVILE